MTASLPQLMRYGIVGFATNAAGYLLYLLVTWLGMGPKTTMTLLYVAGMLMGYYGNSRYAFSYDGNPYSGFVRYGLVHLCGYALNFSLLHVFVDRMGYPHQIVQAVAILVVAAFLFVGFRFFVFAQRSDRVSGEGG